MERQRGQARRKNIFNRGNQAIRGRAQAEGVEEGEEKKRREMKGDSASAE